MPRSPYRPKPPPPQPARSCEGITSVGALCRNPGLFRVGNGWYCQFHARMARESAERRRDKLRD